MTIRKKHLNKKNTLEEDFMPAKVVPVPADSSSHRNQNERCDERIVSSFNKTKDVKEDQQDLLLEEDNQPNTGHVKDKKPVKMEGCFSMRVVIILLIIVLLLTCSIFIWLASFIGSNQAVTELTSSLIEQVGKKIMVFLSGEISPCADLAWTVADDFNMGLIPRRPPFEYLFRKNLVFRPSSVGIYFANEFYAYFNLTIFPNGVPTQEFTIYIKPQDYIGVEHWYANETDGSLIGLVMNQTTPFVVPSLPYWITSFKYFNSLGVDGVYGDPYVVVNSTTCIFYSAKLFDPVLLAQNNTKKVIGFTKVNLSLSNIERYLSTLSLLGKGYVLVSEPNDLVIGGSINTTALNRISRVSLFELTDRNAGILMQQVKSTYGSIASTPDIFQISSLGIDYRISRMQFTLENIRWNVFLIVYSEDVSRTTTITTAISIGVAVAVIVLGLITSVLIGYLITQPLRYLKSQFMKIKRFDLDQVHFTSSRFKEIDSIYEDLHDMVVWLNEFKSFLPETIFNQLRNMDQDSNNDEQHKKMTSTTKMQQQGSNNADSNHQLNSKDNPSYQGDLQSSSSAHNLSSLSGSHRGGKYQDMGNLFKLGLNEKDVSVVNIKLIGMCQQMSASEITNVFSKIANGLSVLSKTMHADLHILSVDEYQCSFVGTNNKKKANIAALEAALKISKTLENCLSNDRVRVCIGVASGRTHVGNLGTHQLRFYSIVGPLISNAKKLSALCQVIAGCSILADSNTMSMGDAKNAFVVRPVERLVIENEGFHEIVSSVYHVIKENHVVKDEWMYELEQQKANSRFKDFEAAFSVLESDKLSSMTDEMAMSRILESQVILQKHLEQHPEDAVTTNRILKVFETICQKSKQEGRVGQALASYRTVLKKSFEGMTNMSNLIEIDSSSIE
ncbi:hypothetical protein FDP41_010980 [Naegleria fowleri]|uniref:Guanylate cyclase domain-containing protein n=1 Tax=Naegleria fowleri TaxID=5763 RepID=A0A6A5C7W8_NAEFO|nr:uncharacterized protein FDP41_010980 [Naegleria fowleri]KAF0983002.1 hypothetical protein FDP41_010980 [Naegleria fowleri]